MNAAERRAAAEQLLGQLRADASSGELRRPASGGGGEAFYRVHLTRLDHLDVWVAWCEHGKVDRSVQRRIVHVGTNLDVVLEQAERRLDSKLGGRSGRYHCHAGHARFTSGQIGCLRARAA